MGLLSKIWKGFKKVVKKIGKGIKKLFKKVGKFFGKMGMKRDWRIFNNRMSKFYTTSTYDLLRVQA